MCCCCKRLLEGSLNDASFPSSACLRVRHFNDENEWRICKEFALNDGFSELRVFLLPRLKKGNKMYSTDESDMHDIISAFAKIESHITEL